MMKKTFGMVLLVLLSSSAIAATNDATLSTLSKSERTGRYNPDQMGVRLGMTRVEQLGDPIATYGVYGNYGIGNNILLGGALDYWRKSNASLSDTTVDAHDLIAAVEGKFVFTDVRSPFRPYLVAAAVIHRFDITETNQVANFLGGKLEDKYRGVNGKLGLDYGGGAMLQLNRSIDLLGELRVRDIVETGIDLSQTSFTAGLNFLM